MARLPQVSGAELSRQRGSHARYRFVSSAGVHFVTVPMHPVIAKGTLNDILSSVSVWTGIAKDDLIDRL